MVSLIVILELTVSLQASTRISVKTLSNCDQYRDTDRLYFTKREGHIKMHGSDSPLTASSCRFVPNGGRQLRSTAGLFLLLAVERKQSNTRHFDDLESHTRNIAPM